ncbi:hypothetical protein Tco_0773470 [Tanacetum coccineum]|uniref:Uncharacterized protein n=1 Tax=Tanacetum coccineum TaxID=301880 RepID=A0ABQ4ZKW0_9ASTR
MPMSTVQCILVLQSSTSFHLLAPPSLDYVAGPEELEQTPLSPEFVLEPNTLAEYMILSNAENHPPMLDKDLYDSWKSRMELYMQNREHRRMILESVEHGPLIWPTVEDNGD